MQNKQWQKSDIWSHKKSSIICFVLWLTKFCDIKIYGNLFTEISDIITDDKHTC